MSIVLQFFPNGEFSQGVDTSKRRRDKPRRDEPYKPPLNKERRDEYLQWREQNHEIHSPNFVHTCNSVYVSGTGKKYTLLVSKENECCLGWEDTVNKKYQTVLNKNIRQICFEWRLTPLVHQSVESCENPGTPIIASSRKKLESMTKPMARNIRNGVYLLEQQPGGKDCLSFLTLTLPNLSTKGLDDCCKNWDYMVKRFLDWLRIRIESQNMPFLYVYATEIQTKRLQNRHEYAPHLHLVFRGRDGKKKPWVISPKQARKAWSRCIASVVDEPFNGVALENLQRIRYSAARYLGKYLSKGKCKVPNDTEETSVSSLRTQWGGMAREISRAIKSNIYKIAGEATRLGVAFHFLRDLPKLVELGLVRYFKDGFIPLGVDKTTGQEYGLHVCTGALSTPTFEGGIIPILEYLFNGLDCCE